MLTDEEAIAQAKAILPYRQAEADNLDKIYRYWRGKQQLPIVPSGVPIEIRRLAKMSRVNVVKLAIDVPAQSLYVAGFRSEQGEDEAPQWDVWQANRFDARQTAVHRASLAYGVSYVRVTPGAPAPVLRGVGPRHMTTVYGEDESWPRYALECIQDATGKRYRLYDDAAIYFLAENADGLEIYDISEHGLGVCPIVRFRNVIDLDDDQLGEIEPLMPLQDQIDVTTFDLLVAQHFQSFRQRYILGWTAKNENDKITVAASRFLTFADADVKVGEFSEVNLAGYLDSRTAGVENLATISQTPPHHLLGKLVNLSAEALVAAEAGQRRKVGERQINFGESWEQVFALVAKAGRLEGDDGAQVRWQDTEARSFAAVVDALGKLATQLGIPPEELWERIPGVTQQDINRWKKARQGEPTIPLKPATASV